MSVGYIQDAIFYQDYYSEQKHLTEFKKVVVTLNSSKYSISTGIDTLETPKKKAERTEDASKEKSKMINYVEAKTLKALADEYNKQLLFNGQLKNKTRIAQSRSFYGVLDEDQAGQFMQTLGPSWVQKKTTEMHVRMNVTRTMETVYAIATGDTTFPARYKTRKAQIDHIVHFANSPLGQFMHNTKVSFSPLIRHSSK